jgi:phosphinothricin acetyltransferase
VAIYNAAIPELATADVAPVSIESQAEWFESHTTYQFPIWVSTSGGDVIGWLSLNRFYAKPVYDATAEVSVYVERGTRRTGIARELLSAAIDRGPGLGLKRLLGLIYADNVASLQLFADMGFDRWGMLPRITDREGEEVDVIIVGRRV